MKLTTVPIAVVLFGLIPLLLVGFFNQANAPLGLVDNETSINGTYNRFIENSERTAEIKSIIDTAENDESGGNFLSNIGKIWSSTKLMAGSFGDATDLTFNAGLDLEIPPAVRLAGLSILIIAILGILITIAARSGRI